MKRHIIFFLIIFYGNLSKSVAQGLIPDSIVEVPADSMKLLLKDAPNDLRRFELLNYICSYYQFQNADSALVYAERCIQLAERMDSKTALAKAIRNKGDAISKLGNDSLAITFYNQSLKIELPASGNALKANILRELGSAHYHLANYNDALTAYFEAVNLLTEDSLKSEKASVLNNIGNVYYFVNMDEAPKYYQQALNIYVELDDFEGIASQYGNLGLVYINTQKFDEAIVYCSKSLEAYKELGWSTAIARALINLAYAHQQINQSGLALKYARESLEIRNKKNDLRGIAVSTLMVGNIYSKLEDYGEAVQYLEYGLKLVDQLGMQSYKLEALFNLAKSYAILGQSEKALKLYPQVIALKDSIYDSDTQELMAEMDAKYQSFEKENTIKLLTTEAELAELQLRKRETYLLTAVIVTFLLGIMSLILYFFYRVRTNANIALEKKNNEISLQKEVIEEKNLHITDSIRYAERLQAAILPKDEMFAKHFLSHTILYKPKDIVSGDFYWMEQAHGLVFLAAADCTGHGVPGAMVSMVGFQGLNKAVLEEKLISPAAILQRLSDYVEEAFEKSGGSVKDGMDICLVAIDTKKRTVSYSGAHNALWILTSKEKLPNANLREEENGHRVFELKADRRSIGGFMDAGNFTETAVELNEGDRLFLFSDGFADQFGGPQGKKLGSKRMRETVREMSLSGNLAALGAIFEDWKGEEEQVDDVTVISVAL